ncbi:MAG: fibronectin type III domain-containing protein, partial [Acidimicrobiales bacterium]
VSVSGQSVTVSWSPSVDDGGDSNITYSVSFGGESGSTQGSSLTFDGVAPGTYTASVTASNTGGTSAGGVSGPFTVDAPIGTPGAPQGASASVDGQTVNVAWSTPADDGGDPNITYEITLGGETPKSTTGTSVAFSDVPPGDYVATVTASNSAGEGGSAQTNSVTVQAPADVPGTPGDLTVTPAGQGVAISWNAPADNGSPITGYQVNLSGSITTVPSSPASFENLAPGDYSVSVAAINGVGTGAAAGPESFTIEAPIEPPGVPGSVTGSVSGQTVNLSWTRPSDGGDPDLSYTVTLSNGASQTVTGTSAQFNNVGAGVYTASVTATNSAGTGGAGTSAAFSVFSVPSAPRNLAAAADGSSVIATWDPPASDGNQTLTGYSIRLELNGSVLATDNVDSTTSSVRFDGRSPAVYTVVVSASNARGAGAEAAVDVEVGSTAPSAPTNVSGSATFQTVTVTWDPPLSAGNTALTGYEVTIGTVVETVTAGTRSLVVVDIEPGTYIAQVRAINAGGKSLPGESASFRTETVFSPFESSEDLISQQYADFLGRAPDQAGINYWTGVLGADRNQGPIVIESFMRSEEFAPRRSVARLYLAFFDRAPDRAGFDFWTGVVRNGGQLNDIAAAFADSAEFRNTYGELNDAEFIALVYNNVLLRAPDLAGFRFWLDRLDDPGVSRGDLMVAFSESAEFKRNSGPAVDVIMTYRGMLDRAPDAAGFSFWVGAVAGRADALKTLIFNFLVSEEYSNRVR